MAIERALLSRDRRAAAARNEAQCSQEVLVRENSTSAADQERGGDGIVNRGMTHKPEAGSPES